MLKATIQGQTSSTVTSYGHQHPNSSSKFRIGIVLPLTRRALLKTLLDQFTQLMTRHLRRPKSKGERLKSKRKQKSS